MNHNDKLIALDAALVQGLDDIQAGRITPADTVFDALEAKYLRIVEDRMKSDPS